MARFLSTQYFNDFHAKERADILAQLNATAALNAAEAERRRVAAAEAAAVIPLRVIDTQAQLDSLNTVDPHAQLVAAADPAASALTGPVYTQPAGEVVQLDAEGSFNLNEVHDPTQNYGSISSSESSVQKDARRPRGKAKKRRKKVVGKKPGQKAKPKKATGKKKPVAKSKPKAKGKKAPRKKAKRKT